MVFGSGRNVKKAPAIKKENNVGRGLNNSFHIFYESNLHLFLKWF